jgi:ferredoxin-NADP reductase
MQIEHAHHARNPVASAIKPLRRFLQQPWLESIVRFSAIENSLRTLHPLLSLSQVRARVVRVIDETPDCKTFVLQPNALWRRDTLAGQFVRVRCEINGRRVERAYSLSSRPGARRIAITVKRHADGLMSNHLHQHLKPGSILDLSQAHGDFVLPTLPGATLPAKILLLSAGSGITPVMAMLRDLQARRYDGSVAFVHTCKRESDLIFAADLRAIAASFPAMVLHLHYSQNGKRLDMAQLQNMVPDLAERPSWVCGPLALMQAAEAFWQSLGVADKLQTERFVAVPRLPASAPGQSVQVRLRNGKQFATRGSEPLLQQAEQAGLNPKHGCRIGICRSCQCVKRSGTVENLQTGEICAEPDQLIRLCISAARSDLDLDLNPDL